MSQSRIVAPRGVSFSAHKNAVNQTGIPVGVQTLVTFGAVRWGNEGGHYNVATSEWTPPAGLVQIQAACFMNAGMEDGVQLGAELWKNGALFHAGAVVVCKGAAAGHGVFVSSFDRAAGADIYTIRFRGIGAVDKSISGAITHTWLQGAVLG